MTDALLIAVPAAPVFGALLVRLPRTPAGADRVNLLGASVTAAVALTASVLGMFHGGQGLHGSWFLLDRAGASFLAVIAVVGWCSAIVSPAYLAGAGKSSVHRAPGARLVLHRPSTCSGLRCWRSRW